MVVETSRKKLDKRTVERLIILFKNKMREEEVPFVKVFLFGSYSNGTAHGDSDIDIAVIIPSDISKSASKKLHIIHWLAKLTNVKLEAHIISDGDLKNPWLTLPAEVRKHGIAV